MSQSWQAERTGRGAGGPGVHLSDDQPPGRRAVLAGRGQQRVVGAAVPAADPSLCPQPAWPEGEVWGDEDEFAARQMALGTLDPGAGSPLPASASTWGLLTWANRDMSSAGRSCRPCSACCAALGAQPIPPPVRQGRESQRSGVGELEGGISPPEEPQGARPSPPPGPSGA